jgi:hypothetical protein
VPLVAHADVEDGAGPPQSGSSEDGRTDRSGAKPKGAMIWPRSGILPGRCRGRCRRTGPPVRGTGIPRPDQPLEALGAAAIHLGRHGGVRGDQGDRREGEVFLHRSILSHCSIVRLTRAAKRGVRGSRAMCLCRARDLVWQLCRSQRASRSKGRTQAYGTLRLSDAGLCAVMGWHGSIVWDGGCRCVATAARAGRHPACQPRRIHPAPWSESATVYRVGTGPHRDRPALRRRGLCSRFECVSFGDWYELPVLSAPMGTACVCDW